MPPSPIKVFNCLHGGDPPHTSSFGKFSNNPYFVVGVHDILQTFIDIFMYNQYILESSKSCSCVIVVLQHQAHPHRFSSSRTIWKSARLTKLSTFLRLFVELSLRFLSLLYFLVSGWSRYHYILCVAGQGWDRSWYAYTLQDTAIYKYRTSQVGNFMGMMKQDRYASYAVSHFCPGWRMAIMMFCNYGCKLGLLAMNEMKSE